MIGADTTIVVPSDTAARVDGDRNVRLRPGATSAFNGGAAS